MPALTSEHEAVIGVITHRGIVSSRDLQRAISRSQATISRLLADLSDRIVVVGRARATRYALPKPLRGLPARQPLAWTGADGVPRPLGTLTLLTGDFVHLESDLVAAPPAPALPWFLAPLRAQGFLGRLHAQRLGAGLSGDPERWSLENVLFAAWHLHDAPGAITLGEAEAAPPAALLPPAGAALAPALDALAADVAGTLPAGSSAGGEQPKLLAVLEGGQHVLVKFTPPRGTPFGERWHDLLHAECLALQVLADHGVAVARARIVESARRSYLVSERFDRIGAHGRRHAVAIGDVHRAFVADSYSHWAASAQALAQQGRLSALDAARAKALFDFGRLIGNTDMHSGNLSLLVELDGLARGRFELAPVYDMLPMRWRPDALMGGAADYVPFEPDRAAAAGPAAGPAREFWLRLAEHESVGRALRETAAAMAERMVAY